MTANGFRTVKVGSPEERELLAAGWYVHEKDDTTVILHRGRRAGDEREPDHYTFDGGVTAFGLHPDQVQSVSRVLEYYGGYGSDDAVAHALIEAEAWKQRRAHEENNRAIVREIERETAERMRGRK